MSEPANPVSVLAIDAGNTRIKWGLSEGRRWVATGAVVRQDVVRLSDAWKALPVPNKIVASNVAGEIIRAELGVLTARWHLTPQWVTATPAQCGVVNGYRQPGQLGCDRWAALIGAHELHHDAAVVVMAGTAITIDALTADGRFLGGLILPGLDMMIDALTTRTAGIRVEPGEFQVFPTTTRDAVWSAAIQASVGAIERMRAALQAAGEANPAIMLSGGAAAVIEAHLQGEVVRAENLVLEGLLCIATG